METKAKRRRSNEAIERQRAAVSGPRNYNFGKPRTHGKTLWLKLPDETVVAMRSRWEAFFADKMTQDGVAWEYEPETFILLDGSAYTPDFLVQTPDGTLEIHETKGWMREDANVKLKVTASLYWLFPVYLITKEGDGFSCRLIPIP